MTEGEITAALLDYVEGVLPAGTPIVAMDADAVRPPVAHAGGMIVSIDGVGTPEPAYSTTTRELDGGVAQTIDVAFLVECYGEPAVDWCRRVAGLWMARGGPAAVLRATGVNPRTVDQVREVSVVVDTGHEPRAQCILRAYAPWTSPEAIPTSAGVTDTVDASLDLVGDDGTLRAVAAFVVEGAFLALDDGTPLLLDDLEQLMLVL
jgi:hypothetical protein